MTITEMHTSFKLGLDKVDSLGYPNFLEDEIDLFLNQAQERIVKQRLGVNNIKQAGFEAIQKRTDDLRELVKNATLTPNASTSDNKPNGVFVTLPTDYWFIINEEANLSFSCNGTTQSDRIMVRAIQHDDYNKIIKDPFNKPSKDEFIIRLMYQNSVELITGNNETVNAYYLRYIKKPLIMDYNNNVDCELANHIHQEIVDEAIKIALEDIEAQRQGTFPTIQNTNE